MTFSFHAVFNSQILAQENYIYFSSSYSSIEIIHKLLRVHVCVYLCVGCGVVVTLVWGVIYESTVAKSIHCSPRKTKKAAFAFVFQ